ncbi:MAG: DUF3737 family protein, partial [Bacteroidales bacterium]|nr:DUF3737 family protein [Bacteroidales bacterium]
DDIALEAGTKSVVYAKALANMQAISLSLPAPAVAIKRNNNHLINRIKRITNMKKNNKMSKEKLVAISGITIMLSALVALTGFSTKSNSFTEQPEENNIRVSSSHKGEYLSGYPGSFILTQDTLRKQESSTIRTTWTDPADNKEKEVDMRINEGQLIELKIDGEIIPEEDYHIYQDLIDDTIADYEKAMKELEDLDMEEIERDIEKAMKELEDLDMEEIERDVEKAMKELEDLDMEEIERDVEKAMKELEDLDMEEIERDIQEAMKGIENIDMQEIEMDIREAMLEMENIDMQEIELDIREALLEMENIDMEELELDIREALKEIEKIDMQELKTKIDSIRNRSVKTEKTIK